MEPTTLFLLTLGAGLCLAGIGFLFSAWQAGREDPWHGRRLAAGWALLAASALIWAEPAGTDRAFTFAILWAGLGALAWIAATTSWTTGHRRRPMRDRPSNDIEPAPLSGNVRHGVAVFLVAGPLSFVAATSVTLAILTLLPSTPGATALVISALSLPVIWACAMLWSCIDPSLKRPSIWLSSATAVSAAVILVL